MLTFFRKIRQGLLKENKFSKYALYAIGEIILVVIGILIAVQINTYVSKQKQEADNKVYLNKMIVELELNKKRMAKLTSELDGRVWTNYENAVANCDSLLKLLYKGFKPEDIPKLTSLKLTAGGSTLNAHTAIYEELLNTGKLYSIGSDSLTNDIKNYYKMLAREEIYNESNNDEVYEALNLLEDNVNQISRDYQYGKDSFSWENYPWLFDKNSKQYKTFQKAVYKMYSAQSNNLNKMKKIVVYSDELIATIKMELNKN